MSDVGVRLGSGQRPIANCKLKSANCFRPSCTFNLHFAICNLLLISFDPSARAALPAGPAERKGAEVVGLLCTPAIAVESHVAFLNFGRKHAGDLVVFSVRPFAVGQ